MKMILALVAATLTLAGCTTASLGPLLETVGVDPAAVTQIEDRAIGTAIKPIPVYCAGTQITRKAFRDRVNAHPGMGGNEIAIWCEGDPPVTIGADAAGEPASMTMAPVPLPKPGG